MTIIEALVLGIIQGITEFLPVSSSGHLAIAQYLLGFSTPPILFDIVVHVGTLMAIIVFFRHSIRQLSLKYLKFLFIGTIPAVVVGFILKPFISDLFSSLHVVALGLLATSILLFSTKKTTSTSQSLTSQKALIIGLFQALAITPGISRSGSTITAGLHSGLPKATAFEFSFLLSIPTILGALVLELLDLSSTSTQPLLPLLIGFISAACCGFLALKLLKQIAISANFHRFGYYTLTASLILVSYLILS